MEKEKILSNLENLTAEQLFEEIKLGNVTLDELKNTGNLKIEKRNKINNLQSELDLKDEQAWEQAKYGNETLLSDYITNYPSGKFVQDAKDKIRHLEDTRRNAQSAKYGILEKVKLNSNGILLGDIKNYLKNKVITEQDLLESGIPQKIIDAISDEPPRLKLGDTPTSIPDGYTEVYFWGMPGSGKTCALAALLSTANKKGYFEGALGNGYDYMTRLSNIFLDEVAILPPPTPFETTQYLPFALKKPNEKFSRSISLIELSGEIFKCFHYENSGKELPTNSHIETLASLNNFLKGKNRKIHFFFIDYETGNKKDYDGYTQANYLQSAAIYFNKPENNFFSKTTDAIYIVLTKSDLMPCREEERVNLAIEHFKNNNFSAFINSLKKNCIKHSINAGILTVEPFSLGNVYFNQICSFDDRPSNKILEILFNRVKQEKKSILDIFNK